MHLKPDLQQKTHLLLFRAKPKASLQEYVRESDFGAVRIASETSAWAVTSGSKAAAHINIQLHELLQAAIQSEGTGACRDVKYQQRFGRTTRRLSIGMRPLLSLFKAAGRRGGR